MGKRSSPATLTDVTYERGLAALAARDPALAHVLSNWGDPPFWTHAPGFPGIVSAILAQQVSLESAQAAFSKLENALDSVDAERLLSLDDAALRAIGFSRQKASYVRGIAQEIVAGETDLEALESMDDAAARQRLIKIRGIGPWTADTYLLFSLRRADAWPTADLALIKAVQELKGWMTTPAAGVVDGVAEQWRPWRAVAARILWHHYLCERGRSA